MTYRTSHIDLATDFDVPVCRGTLRALEDRYALTADLVGEISTDPILAYWVDGDIERVCSDERTGCFIPGTRIIAAYQGALHHEIVHAVLDTRGVNYFVEEGLAEFVGGYPIVYDPPTDAAPLQQLSLSSEAYNHGKLSYPAAASFSYFLAAQGGDQLLGDLARAVDRDDPPSRIEALIEDGLDMDGPAVEDTYRAEVDHVFPGLSRDGVEAIAFDDLDGLHHAKVDCSDGHTYGPLTTDAPEAYRIFRMPLPARTVLAVRLHGPERARAVVVDAYDGRTRTALDWLAPDLRALPHHEILAGQGTTVVDLPRGDHAILMIGDPEGSHSMHLEIDLLETDAPARRTAG